MQPGPPGELPRLTCGFGMVVYLEKGKETNLDGSVKSDCCVTLHLSSLRRTVGTPHSSRFVPQSGRAFYETVSLTAFYDDVNLGFMPDSKLA